jgi:hypothetical protein
MISDPNRGPNAPGANLAAATATMAATAKFRTTRAHGFEAFPSLYSDRLLARAHLANCWVDRNEPLPFFKTGAKFKLPLQPVQRRFLK